jgi:hypothetical protein
VLQSASAAAVQELALLGPQLAIPLLEYGAWPISGVGCGAAPWVVLHFGQLSRAHLGWGLPWVVMAPPVRLSAPESLHLQQAVASLKHPPNSTQGNSAHKLGLPASAQPACLQGSLAGVAAQTAPKAAKTNGAA